MNHVPVAGARFALLAILAAAAAAAVGSEPRALSLAEAYRLADETSEAVRIRALQAGASDAALAEARSQQYPRLSLELSASCLANPPEGITVHRGELGTIVLPGPTVIEIPSEDLVFVEDAEPTSYKVGATLTQPLFTSGKIAAGIRLAELDRQSAAVELDHQRRTTRRETARAYHGSVLAARSLPLLTAMRAASADIVADRTASFAEGTVTRQAVLEAQASLVSLDAKIVAAREARATALEALAALTGLAAADLDPVDAFREACPDLDEERLQAQAAAGSPDLASARTRLAQAGAKRDLERGGAVLRPDLALSVTAGVEGQRTPFVGSDWTDSWDWNVVVSVGAQVTAFDSGASRARLDAASAEREAASAALAQAQKQVRLSVRKSVEAARRAGVELAERRAKLALAEETAKNARVSFENGVATRGEVRAAEIGRLAAVLDLETAGAALEDALAEIEYGTGVPIGAP
jgi:outer membrane protein TolC